jgi:malate dehydrogenase (oxaloacetate-decarboxylating)
MPPTPSAQFSLDLRVELGRDPEVLARLIGALERAGGLVSGNEVVEPGDARSVRSIIVEAGDHETMDALGRAAADVDGTRLIEVRDRTLELHRGGKIYTGLVTELDTRDDLSMAYTPGVARVCLDIAARPELAREFTIASNTVAVVSDGSAVLGLGDIGPRAAMPVMEGKAMLFKEFAGINAFPICLDTKDPDEIVAAVRLMAPTFGGVNLEDISSPRCFEIEARLIEELDVPVFHDDQHGTAIVVLAALLNACRLTGRGLDELKAVMVGAGAAGVAVARILSAVGIRSLVACDRLGAISTARPDYEDGTMNTAKSWLAEHTNLERRDGSIPEVLEGADLFIGLSGPGIVRAEDLRRMNADPFVFAMANPDPEIRPEEALAHVAVMATGRSDYPNQINNVLAFPGIFRGALDVRATTITEEMKIAAAQGIASVIGPDELAPEYIVPSVFDRGVTPAVAAAVAREAERDGVATSEFTAVAP